MKIRVTAYLTCGLARLAGDRRGGAMVSFAIALPVVIGIALLAVDASRLYNLSTSLQNGADALALAGAAELDRKPDAISRATAAITAMVLNQHKFAAGSSATIKTSSVRFLKSLPATDATAIASASLTSDPEAARFVEVTVATETLNTLLPAGFIGQPDSVNATARAVAGLDIALCASAPLFICDPYAGSGKTIFDAVKEPALRRRQLKLQGAPGGAGQYFAGNYGWLDSPNFNGSAVALREALASLRPKVCFVQSEVHQKTGNVSNADDAINTRFDLWSGPFNTESGNPEYPPALNVRKGYLPGSGGKGACGPKPTSPNQNALGRDSAFPYGLGRLGNGNWNFELYWQTNFGTAAPNGWSNTNLPSRYEVYRYEIEHNLTATKAVSGEAKGEVGTPACYSGGGLSDKPDRRVIHGAIIDCINASVHGNSDGPMPVVAFGKFFLTEPVPSAPDLNAGTIFAELIGLAEPGSDASALHDIVQLYR